jgi:formylmethanofuran dehydrogenase subunit C
MPQENINKIWNAGKLFEEPKPEQSAKEPTPDENKLSNVKRKINVAKAFIPTQEDPFKQKVEAVLKGIEEEPAFAPDTAGEEEKPVPADAEVVVGKGQNEIGRDLIAGTSIYVEGNAGNATGYHMSGGKISANGNVGDWAGDSMSGGEIYVEGNAGGATGSHMSGGEIHLEGDAWHGTGDHMSGGEIRVNGNVKNKTGDSMLGGEIRVNGNAGDWTGCFMHGGTLRIDGDVASFDGTAFISDNKGTIIWKGQTIWENGQQVEPGWTNLNVKEKIVK